MSSPAFVIGNLTRTPQLSRTSDSTPVVNLTVAENSRRQVEGEWVDGTTTYWEIVCFGAQAEHIIASLTKGGPGDRGRQLPDPYLDRLRRAGALHARGPGRGDRPVAALGHRPGKPVNGPVTRVGRPRTTRSGADRL